MSNRYEGKPLLRLLECYALDAIGELAEGDRRNLEAMEPNLSEVYKTSGSWKAIIEAVMQFPPGIAPEIENMWKRNLEVASQSGTEITPQQFAEIFVDQNFV